MQRKRTPKTNALLGFGLALIILSTIWLILTSIFAHEKSTPALRTNTTYSEPGEQNLGNFRKDTYTFGAPSVIALGVILTTIASVVKICARKQQTARAAQAQVAARAAQAQVAALRLGVPTAEVADDISTATQVGGADDDLRFTVFATPAT